MNVVAPKIKSELLRELAKLVDKPEDLFGPSGLFQATALIEGCGFGDLRRRRVWSPAPGDAHCWRRPRNAAVSVRVPDRRVRRPGLSDEERGCSRRRRCGRTSRCCGRYLGREWEATG